MEWGKNNLQQAASVFKKGIAIAPNDYGLHSNLGTVYGLMKDYAAAIEVLEKASELNPTNAKVHIDLGLSYFYNGQNDQAKN